jgi:hypothetical protein
MCIQLIRQQQASRPMLVLAGTMARLAREKGNFFKVFQRQPFQHHIFQLNLHRGIPPVDLNGQLPAAASPRPVVYDFREFFPIDEVCNSIALSHNAIRIPILLFDQFLEIGALGQPRGDLDLRITVSAVGDARLL